MNKKTIFCIVLGLILSVISLFLFKINYSTINDNILSVYFLDVGQGDAILIETPNDNQFLIDAGIDSLAVTRISEQLGFFDKSIDAVLITHPDMDHVGGFPDVFASFSVEYLLDSLKHEKSDVVDEIVKRASLQNTKKSSLKRGDKIFLDIENNIYLEVLFPDEDFIADEKNDTSIVLKLIFGEISFLFTGDASKKVERYLISKEGSRLDSNVLKVGHHGSNTSTSEEFLGYVSPQYAVISAGLNNAYSHPHQEVLDTLSKFEIKILETKNLATIVARSDGREIWFENDLD